MQTFITKKKNNNQIQNKRSCLYLKTDMKRKNEKKIFIGGVRSIIILHLQPQYLKLMKSTSYRVDITDHELG